MSRDPKATKQKHRLSLLPPGHDGRPPLWPKDMAWDPATRWYPKGRAAAINPAKSFKGFGQGCWGKQDFE
jgi:hypothetical protein